MRKPPCPTCAQPTPDGLMCRNCVAGLCRDLKALPGLLAQLQVTSSRQSVTEPATGKRTADEPLPFDWNAADQRWATLNTLTTWIRELDMGDTRDLADNPRALCNWLLDRLERIRSHAAADQLVDEIGYATRSARNAIDLPAELVYCGTCDICDRPLYASPQAAEVECRYCTWAGIEEAVYPVAGRRTDMAAAAEDHNVTKRVILEVAPYYGVPINPSTFRSWTSRGKLTPRGDRAGVPLYRLGDALDLARAARPDEEPATA